MLDEKYKNKININIHALYSCLVTYMKNMEEIHSILGRIKAILVQDRLDFLYNLKQKNIKLIASFLNKTFKNSMLI